jgi:HEAT repeat protein
MARTIILELTDEQEQFLLQQAQQLNLPIESVLLRAALQIPQGLLNPIQPDDQDIYASLSCLFIQMRQARLAQETTTQVPLTDIALTFTQFMKRSGQITGFELINTPDKPYILLYLNPHIPKIPSPSKDNQVPISPQLATIVKDLDHEDPNVRIKAVQALGELARESV